MEITMPEETNIEEFSCINMLEKNRETKQQTDDRRPTTDNRRPTTDNN